jgi:predicted nucleic acid-binding Zn ribbon protein
MEALSLTDPGLFKYQKRCLVCRRRFGARRADAKYCSAACRQKAKRRRDDKLAPWEDARGRVSDGGVQARIEGRRNTIHELTCIQCGRVFHTDGLGAGRLYCSNACRQAAYRERKRKERIAPGLAFLHGDTKQGPV